MTNKSLAMFLAAVKKADEKLIEYPRIVERVLSYLYLDYLAFDIPIPPIISTNKIAKALSSYGHEVTAQMVIEALTILVIEGLLPKGTEAARLLYTEPEKLTEKRLKEKLEITSRVNKSNGRLSRLK